MSEQRDGCQHKTGFGLAYMDPRGDHWVAYFTRDIRDGGKVSAYTTGETATDALAKLIIKAAEAGC
jgi:hypothetical protein